MGTNTHLKFIKVKKSFPLGSNRLIKVINIDAFEVEKGVQMVVHGASGVGKTTFLNLISGIIRPDSGELIIDGINFSTLPEAEKDSFRAKNIGYIFQDFNLLSAFSALENVLLALYFSGHKKDGGKHALEILKRVGLENRLENFANQLSFGEQQRVAIARALVNSPNLVLADEPTASLDYKNGAKVLSLLKEICLEKKATLIVVSHEKWVRDEFEKAIDFRSINCPESTEAI